MILLPRGRSGWSGGSARSVAGTGSSLSDGNASIAEPCLPSIHSTSERTQSGISDHRTPADVTSVAQLDEMLGFFSAMKNPPSVVPRRADARATRFVADRPHPLSGTTLPG